MFGVRLYQDHSFAWRYVWTSFDGKQITRGVHVMLYIALYLDHKPLLER